jgi:hypothetical protein
MTSSKFEVRVLAPNTATRPNGLSARAMLKQKLESVDQVQVDLEGVLLTPSFADEFLGVLLVELGEAAFRRQVKIINVPDTSRSLLQQVLVRRASKPNVDVGAHNALHASAG